MIKETLKNIVIVIVIVVLGIITGLIFMNNEKNIKENEKQEDTKNKIETEITLEENTKIENYINEICNNYFALGRLPIFDDINQANKNWIYGHLKAKEDSYISEENIEKNLKNIFGNDLNIDLKNDNEALEYNNIYFNKETEQYEFFPYGTDMNICYAINTIEKDNEEYIVNVIEYAYTSSAVIGKYEDTRH